MWHARQIKQVAGDKSKQRKQPQTSALPRPKSRKRRAAVVDFEKRKELLKLRRALEELECLPENEATRFQLEREIYNLEQEAGRDEWPEVVEA